MLMDTLAVLSGAIHPLLYGSPLETEGGFDSRDRTAVCHQCQHQDDGRLGSASPIQRGAFAGTESLLADVAAVSLGRARVDLDVALSALCGCRTVGIGTEYIVRVHEIPSGLVVGKILLGPASDCPNLTVKRTPTRDQGFLNISGYLLGLLHGCCTHCALDISAGKYLRS